ncbi:hypothetical protein HNY73_016324 [Argiope bruennichi]|uniref:Uncharacterized protein n=1 Tax=Argiope bruennichi TaxID=94029 RepID=A0A8T0ENB4_ARGBR|nr:hypothetical protein HNY73_016324 [Argiope bruennichi]
MRRAIEEYQSKAAMEATLQTIPGKRSKITNSHKFLLKNIGKKISGQFKYHHVGTITASLASYHRRVYRQIVFFSCLTEQEYESKMQDGTERTKHSLLEGFPDLAHFHLDGFAHKNPYVRVPKSLYSQKVTVCAAVSNVQLDPCIYVIQ